MVAEERWQRTGDWAGADFENSVVMVEIELGTYVGLNATAAAVWDAIERPATAAEIVDYLRARFDVPAARCAAGVAAALERFREVGLAAPA